MTAFHLGDVIPVPYGRNPGHLTITAVEHTDDGTRYEAVRSDGQVVVLLGEDST